MTSCLVAASPAGDAPKPTFSEAVAQHDARLRKRIGARLFVQVRRCWPVDDVVQEVWLAALKRWSTFCWNGTPGSLKRWLDGISRFKELDALRKFRRSERAFAACEPLEEPASPSTCPLTRAEREEIERAIDECVARLPAAQREAFVLVHRRGYSTREAGRLLGITADAAYQRAKRGRHAVIRCLGVHF